MSQNQAITLAITGASGAPYALRLLEQLIELQQQVYLMISRPAQVVMATEVGLTLPSQPKAMATLLRERFGADEGQLQVFGREQWFSPVASGSNAPKAMVVCPCSTSTLSAIACGTSNSLIERAADVVLKERKQLILVPREAPYSQIHLEHMLKLTQMGAIVLPASPGFYHQPQTVDDLINFIVARILDHLDITHKLASRWGES
jgi:flavin prenyltransferase